MFVVIPTAVEPTNPSFHYALESIRRHTNYDVVTIGHDLGHAPHIPTRQHRRDIFTNTDLAMQVACDTPWIGPEFIWSADDIYWLKPAEPVRWAIGRLENAHGSTVYAQRRRATGAFLTERDYPTWDYEAHTPMLIHRDPMRHALRWVRDHLMLDKRSLYGNLTGEPDVVAPDVKLKSRDATLPDSRWFSSNGHPLKYRAAVATLKT